MGEAGKVLAGIVVGAALTAGGVWLWMPKEPCWGRCGAGTQCREQTCMAATPAAPVPPKEKHRRARAPSAVELKPGDDKLVAEGDALGRAEKIDLSEPDARELTQEDLDGVFGGAHGRIERCITESLGDAPLETGKVAIGIRVEKSGEVSRVRVEAPALLQRQGLTRCIRGALASLKFPASGAANVVTYPFELK